MSSNNSKSKALVEFQRRLFASRFFTVSVLLHFIIILAFGGTVLFNHYSEPPDFSGEEGGGFVSADTAAATPPAQQAQTEVAPDMTVVAPSAPASNPADIMAITTSAPSEVSFSIPQISAPTISPNVNVTQSIGPSAPALGANQLSAAQSREIAAFTGGWAKKGGRGGGPGSSPRTREFEFTAYLAKYGDPNDPQRGGDWASTNWVENGKIWGGSLPNLLYMMNKMSSDRIKAAPNAVPLELSSDEIFAKKPPFIFFTGHRDFVLTDREVENLRKYVSLGGCIWGDSSLPGRRSRFDIAFRREMRRVISDADKNWEQLPSNHPLFTKNLYYPEIKEPPAGLNFYKEPVYALKFAGEVAVIYTANDYGDMWQIGLDEKWQLDQSRDEKGRYVALNRRMWDSRTLYYRNLELPAVANAYKFGTNVVIHLLTRWEDRVRGVPTGL